MRKKPFDGITLNNFVIVEYSGESVGEIVIDDILTEDGQQLNLKPGNVVTIMKSKTLENSLNSGVLHYFLIESDKKPLRLYDIIRLV